MEPLSDPRLGGIANLKVVPSVTASQNKKTGNWKLRCRYYPSRGSVGVRKDTSYKYDSRAAALADVERWSLELCTKGRRSSSASFASGESSCLKGYRAAV